MSSQKDMVYFLPFYVLIAASWRANSDSFFNFNSNNYRSSLMISENINFDHLVHSLLLIFLTIFLIELWKLLLIHSWTNLRFQFQNRTFRVSLRITNIVPLLAFQSFWRYTRLFFIHIEQIEKFYLTSSHRYAIHNCNMRLFTFARHR